MGGRKPLPLAIKQIKGTVQKCRTNPHEPRPTTALCTPPEYMSDVAKEAWNYAVANSPPGLLSAARWCGAGTLGQLLWPVPRGVGLDQSRRCVGDDHQDTQRHLASLATDGCDPRVGHGDEGLRDRDGLHPGRTFTDFRAQ